MYKIILDPKLFECAPGSDELYQMSHFQFLSSCVNFINNYCDIILDLYDGAPYCCSYNPYSPPPITNSHYLRIKYNIVQKQIQSIINKRKSIIHVTESDMNTEIDSMNFINNSQCKTAFLNYLGKIIDDSSDLIILLGKDETVKQVRVQRNESERIIPTITNPQYDCSNQVVNFLLPPKNESDLFPNKVACSELNNSFTNELHDAHLSATDNIGIIKKYGFEFALRNLYIKNDKLTRSNKNYTVFLHRLEKFAISLDQEHGGIEVFKKIGKTVKYKKGRESSFVHMGEYSFSGNR